MVMGMGKRDLITKDFALYVVHYFASMLTWSKKDILEEIDRTIKEAKPEDAVRVVRCKDCVFCHYNSSNETYKCSTMNGMYRTVEPNEFCSYGERKDNG